jgi:hypothetical protein
LHLVAILFPHINDDVRSKSLQINVNFISFHIVNGTADKALG